MATFFTYRIKRVYPSKQGPTAPATRYIPEFSGDDGTSWRPVYPGDQPQSLEEAQQRLGEVVSAEDTFREEVVNGRLGTLDDVVAYP